MATNGDLQVSKRGQLSLPAAARHRWGLSEGGVIGFLDIGDAVVLVPGGVHALRAELIDALDEQDWHSATTGFGDADLATE